jgi:hypothetical protein
MIGPCPNTRTAPMLAAYFVKAALSAAAVGALLAMLRHATPRAGGLAAAVPINSLPALFWLSLEHGGDYAATAALGSLWGTGLTALLGLAFARAAAVCHVAIAAALACAAVAALAALLWSIPAALTAATVCALLVILAGPAARPSFDRGPQRRARWRTESLLSMGIAGVMSLLVSEVSRHGTPQFGGLLATIPVVGVSALVSGHRQGGAPLMLGVLDGYLTGMLAKAAFLGALCLAWEAGVGSWAWGFALAGSLVALLAQRNLRRVRTLQLGRQA